MPVAASVYYAFFGFRLTGYAGLYFLGVLTLYALALGAVGGLLARYIWLPDPTP